MACLMKKYKNVLLYFVFSLLITGYSNENVLNIVNSQFTHIELTSSNTEPQENKETVSEEELFFGEHIKKMAFNISINDIDFMYYSFSPNKLVYTIWDPPKAS